MTQEFSTLQTKLSNIITALRCQEFATTCTIDDDCGTADQVCFNGGCIEDRTSAQAVCPTCGRASATGTISHLQEHRQPAADPVGHGSQHHAAELPGR